MRRSFAVLCLVLLVSACTGAVPPDASGEEIYQQVCARCHGSDLGGGTGPALGPGSDAAAKADEFYLQTITRGRGRMPSFGSSLTDEQIERVIEYLRARQAP